MPYVAVTEYNKYYTMARLQSGTRIFGNAVIDGNTTIGSVGAISGQFHTITGNISQATSGGIVYINTTGNLMVGGNTAMAGNTTHGTVGVVSGAYHTFVGNINQVTSGGIVYINTNGNLMVGGNLTSRTQILSSTFTANTNITSYDFDHAGGTVSISNAQTINFPNFSGMIIINNHVSGSVATWIAGGGGVALLGATNSATGIGTITFTGGQYVWTSNANPAGLHTITTIRTRNAA